MHYLLVAQVPSPLILALTAPVQNEMGVRAGSYGEHRSTSSWAWQVRLHRLFEAFQAGHTVDGTVLPSTLGITSAGWNLHMLTSAVMLLMACM